MTLPPTNTASDIAFARKKLYKQLSEVGNSSEVVLYAEIMFTYAYSRRDVGGGAATQGFHGDEGIHNVAFWDGSARVTEQDRD